MRKVLVLLTCFFLVPFFEYTGFFEVINNYFYDLSFRIRGPKTPSDKIIIISVDESTLQDLGRWPIRRSHYASLLDRLRQADVIAIDILFTEPSQDDAGLAAAIARHGRVILPVHIGNEMNIGYPVGTLSPYRTGHIHIEQGIDGVARGVFNTLFFRDHLLPSFSSVIYEAATGQTFQRSARPDDRNTPFPPFGKGERKRVSDEKGPGEPITQMDFMRINYFGGPETFKRIPLTDVLKGVYPGEFFKNKIILVGISAAGLGDHAFVPFTQERKGMPGVEIQANILNTILAGNSIKVLSPWVRWTIALILTLSFWVCFLKGTEKNGAILGLGILFLISVVDYGCFSKFHVWFAPAVYYASTILVFVLTYTFKLSEAISSLDRTYSTILPYLRWKEKMGEIQKGLSGIFTPGGIDSKAMVLTDVTNELIFEKELTDRALMSDVLGVVVFDPEGQNIFANSQASLVSQANLINIEKADEFIKGLSPYIIEKIGLDDIFTALNTAGGIVTFTVSLPRPKKRFFKADASYLSVAEKRYLLINLIDITKIKEMEILKGQIVTIVSHELKTPMTNIQGFSELLVQSLEGQEKKFADIILEESARLTKFVNTFLDINRIEEGRQQITKTLVNLSDLIHDTAAKIQPIAREKGITLYALAADPVRAVLIDRDLTEQCLLNLTENAIKYSPPDRDVAIRLSEQAHSVTIEVVDNGYGIREEDLGRIFEKFFRSYSETTEGIKGSGLGLTFVKEAVEAQGGQVVVESTFGKGAIFSIIFPKSG
jgi:signal transduction histidine kinase/CHASE2 domain-containing sensor protein